MRAPSEVFSFKSAIWSLNLIHFSPSYSSSNFWSSPSKHSSLTHPPAGMFCTTETRLQHTSGTRHNNHSAASLALLVCLTCPRQAGPSRTSMRVGVLCGTPGSFPETARDARRVASTTKMRRCDGDRRLRSAPGASPRREKGRKRRWNTRANAWRIPRGS